MKEIIGIRKKIITMKEDLLSMQQQVAENAEATVYTQIIFFKRQLFKIMQE